MCCCHPLHPSPSWQAQGFEENHVADTERCFSTEFNQGRAAFSGFPQCFFHLMVMKPQSLWVGCSVFLQQAELFLPELPRLHLPPG